MNPLPRAAILTVGNEVLKGSVLNSNAQFLGSELTSLGFDVIHQAACRDQIDEIKTALEICLQRAETVILSGGLGPTPDDLTRDAVAEFLEVPLEFSARQFRFIEKYYRKHRRKIPAIVRKEALFPRGSKPLFNHFGIALGFAAPYGSKLIIALPGVPFELENMFLQLVAPVLKKHFPASGCLHRLVIKTLGLSEPAVMEKLRGDFFDDPFEFGIYPGSGEVALRLYSRNASVLKRLKSKAESRLEKFIYARGEKTLAETLAEKLTAAGKTLAIAESCTGGLLASWFTQIPGASRFFIGSVTAYANSVKVWLGVKPGILKLRGAVSAEVAAQLALAIRSKMNSDFGIAITGIAGPQKDGKKPVGLVFIAIASPRGVKVWKESFLGKRRQIQERAAKKAMERLWRILSLAAVQVLGR